MEEEIDWYEPVGNFVQTEIEYQKEIFFYN